MTKFGYVVNVPDCQINVQGSNPEEKIFFQLLLLFLNFFIKKLFNHWI